MKLHKPTRILLATLLGIAGVVTMGKLIQYGALILSASVGMSSFLFLFAGGLGGVFLLVFILVAIKALLQNKIATKSVGVIVITLSAVVALFVLLLAYGLIKDLVGATCTGFFGAQVSCTVPPMLLLHFIVQPVSLIMAGPVSLFGIYEQLIKR